MSDGLYFRFCVLGVCGLESVFEVGGEECYGWLGEVEVVSEFLKELGMGDCVVGFGEVYVYG